MGWVSSGLQISDGDENWRAPRDPTGGLAARAIRYGWAVVLSR